MRRLDRHVSKSAASSSSSPRARKPAAEALPSTSIDLDMLWGIVRRYSKRALPNTSAEVVRAPGADSTSSAGSTRASESLEDQYLLQEALRWRSSRPTPHEIFSSNSSYSLPPWFVSSFADFFDALQEQDPQLYAVLVADNFFGGDANVFGGVETPQAARLPRYSSGGGGGGSGGGGSGGGSKSGKKSKGRGKKAGKRDKRGSRHRNSSSSKASPKLPRASGEGGVNPEADSSSSGPSALTRENSDISVASGTVDGDDEAEEEGGGSEPIQKLVADAAELQSLAPLLLACRMMLHQPAGGADLQAGGSGGGGGGDAVDDSIDASEGGGGASSRYSLGPNDAAVLRTLRVEDPQRLHRQFAEAALKGLFRSSAGRKMTVANLSGYLQLQEDKGGIVATGQSAFGTCGLFGWRPGGPAAAAGAGFVGGGKWYYEIQILTFGKAHFCQVRTYVRAVIRLRLRAQDEALGTGVLSIVSAAAARMFMRIRRQVELFNAAWVGRTCRYATHARSLVCRCACRLGGARRKQSSTMASRSALATTGSRGRSAAGGT
jgi:hypothetical protein